MDSRGPFRVYGVPITPTTLGQATRAILEFAESNRCKSVAQGAFVVTINLDHARLLRVDARFRHAYLEAWSRVADGVPILWLSRIAGAPLTERVNGTDLMWSLCSAAESTSLRMALVGGEPGVAARATERLTRFFPELCVAASIAPEFGFDTDRGQSTALVLALRKAKVDIVFFGIGSPRQEVWAAEHFADIGAMIICIGGSLDLISERTRRAPRVLQSMGLEWLYRLSKEPRRLAHRYCADALELPSLVTDAVRQRLMKPPAKGPARG